MAFKNDRLTYRLETDDKVSMVMVLEQFDDSYQTIAEIKNTLMVSGSVVLDTQQAVILSRLIAPHYPHLAARILEHGGIERYPMFTEQEWKARRFELANRLR